MIKDGLLKIFMSGGLKTMQKISEKLGLIPCAVNVKMLLPVKTVLKNTV